MSTPQRTLSQPGIPRPDLSPTKIFTIGYFPNHNVLLQFSCLIFLSNHRWYIEHKKTDFDLQPTSVIYTQYKACVIDDTEGLQIKILR